MTINKTIPEFSLLGGPLHYLGRRLHLVRDGAHTIRLGLALGWLAWGVLALLALMRGAEHRLFSLELSALHARLLVVIPLFFVCETWVAPAMAEFVRNIIRSGLVPEDEVPALAAEIRRINRLADSRLVEGVILLASFILPLLLGMIGYLPGRSANFSSVLAESGGKFGPVMAWYLIFCLPLFRFLLFRWVWRLGLWWWFLWRLKGHKLHLLPAHSDGVAGLGFLEVVHEQFLPFIFGLSVFYSATFAEDIAAGVMQFEAVYNYAPLIFIAATIVFCGPLFLFSAKLWSARVHGWSAYMDMASRYVNAFDRKWVQGENPDGEAELGSADLQSLADLTNSVDVVRNLRVAPISR
ncbi:MAG: hypothetical protein PHO37_13960 [Kiritimatiellae bacterium]|nr:hypothetical protein [Kiritimatiellia bacterium]